MLNRDDQLLAEKLIGDVREEELQRHIEIHLDQLKAAERRLEPLIGRLSAVVRTIELRRYCLELLRLRQDATSQKSVPNETHEGDPEAVAARGDERSVLHGSE